MSNIYYGDLREGVKEQFKREWERLERTDIIEAIERGEEDIIVGEYCKTKDCELDC